MKYKVLIQHFGDRQYWAGESREVANEQDAQALIKSGLIIPESEYVPPPPPTPKPKKDKCDKGKKDKKEPEPPPAESPTEPQDGIGGQDNSIVAPAPIEIEPEE